ncbi:MAG: GCN5-like 1 [Piptocephalis tieghemiana]|nr:MAG: GCN5-like 1 [Piptocephalis tieghemiana]
MSTQPPPLLAEAYKAHQKRQQLLSQQSDTRKKEAQSAMDEAMEVAADTLDSQVSDIYRNQQILNQEARHLQSLIERHLSQTHKWSGMVEAVNNAVKEMGDIQHFAGIIERDMREVAVTLRNVKHRNIRN